MDLTLGKHALKMAKPALNVELTTTSSLLLRPLLLETGLPQREQPRRTTQWQALGRGRGYRAPRGRSQPKPPSEQNVHLLQTANDQHPVVYYTDDFQEQCYSLETRQIHSIHTNHAKKKYFVTLPMSATGTNSPQ